jgi:PAS domain S-box-containing protein
MDTLPYLIPYVISMTISTVVGIYSWRRRAVSGARAYAILALGQASWTFGYIFELASPGLKGKIFWDNFQFIGGDIWFIAFLAFVLDYTGRSLSHPKRTWFLLSIVPAAIVLLAYTDGFHGLIRPEALLVHGEPFSALVYDFTFPFYAWAAYCYGLFLIAMIALFARYIRPHRLYRAQVGTIIVGNLIPLVGTMLTVAGVTLTFQRDTTPLTFAIGNLVVAWGLFRFGLFNIVPVARERVVESIGDAVVVFDADDRVVDLNPAARKAVGHLAADVVGKPAAQVFSSWPNLLEQLKDVDQTHTEIVLEGLDGQQHFDLRITPLHNRSGQLAGRVAVVRDITELKMAYKHLQALDRLKDEFVSNVSHELRTPITNIKLHLDLLVANPNKAEAYLATLQRETGRLERIIEDLLYLSRLDQDKMEMWIISIDCNALADQYVVDRQPLAERNGQTLTFVGHEGLPFVQGDVGLLGQALSILLTNALNYTPRGGQVVVSTHLREKARERWVGFRVSDTGPGIAPDEQKQLFERFFRGKMGRESGVPGTGLGLAIVREIAERHGGMVEVVSEGVPGKGAAFSVWLPAN